MKYFLASLALFGMVGMAEASSTDTLRINDPSAHVITVVEYGKASYGVQIASMTARIEELERVIRELFDRDLEARHRDLLMRDRIKALEQRPCMEGSR